jgi:gas vesicle protein
MLLGGMVGGVLGAVASLLLAPKSGSEFIKDLSRQFINQRGNLRTALRKSTALKSIARKVPSRKKVASRPSNAGATHIAMTKTAAHKGHKKKTQPRRRTVTAANKQAATTAHPHGATGVHKHLNHERAVSEAARG